MSVPLGAATASAGVVMPTVSRPTMPMTPTEKDAAVTRLNEAPPLRRDGDVSRRRSAAAAAGSSSAAFVPRDWIGVSPVKANSRAAASNASISAAVGADADSASRTVVSAASSPGVWRSAAAHRR